MLATANVGSNNVSVFSVNETTGALNQLPGSPFATGPNFGIPAPSTPSCSVQMGSCSPRPISEPHTVSVFSTAAAPEYGQCLALTKNTTPKAKKGRYEDPACQKLYAKKGVVKAKGNYEWYPGAPANCVAEKKGEYTTSTCDARSAKAHKGTFERQLCYPNCAKYTSTSSGARWKLTNYASDTTVATVECTAGTDNGEILGSRTGIDTMTWTGCHDTENGKECRGLNPDPKEIETSPNNTEVVSEPGGAATVYKNSDNDIYAVFSCEGVGYFEVRGAIAGTTVGDFDAMSTSSTTDIDEAFSEPGEFYETLARYERGEPTFKTSEVLATSRLRRVHKWRSKVRSPNCPGHRALGARPLGETLSPS